MFYENLMVPAVLYGPNRSRARARFKTIARRVAKCRSLTEALKGVDLIPISAVQGDFAAMNSHGLLFTGDNLWLDVAFEEFAAACPNHSGLMEPMIISGLDLFWFSLVICTA